MKANIVLTVVCVTCTAMFSAAEYPKDIYVNHPDFVVFVPHKPITHQWKKGCDDVASKRQRGDSYNDHFQVLDDPSRGLLYAFWTQATWEGCTDMHIAFSKSADNGRTWTEPVVLAGSENRANPKLTASWQQPMLSASGRLYCLWNQQAGWGDQVCGWHYGIWSDDGGETWSAPNKITFTERMDLDPSNRDVPPLWCSWQRPLRLGEGGRYFVGCSRHGKAPYDVRYCTKVEFWQFENIDENPDVGDIRISYFATNRVSLSADKVLAPDGVKIFSPKKEGPGVEEAGIVKLPDGRLFALMRSSVGYPVWSQSRDGGKTWSAPKVLVDCTGRAVPHPRSPCPIYDWKGPEAASGTYFALVHNTFDLNGETAYQKRGPLYLIAGRFDPKGDQPIRFGAPRLFAPRSEANSFYASYTVVNGEGVLWFNDRKYYLLGRKIGSEWFDGFAAEGVKPEVRAEWEKPDAPSITATEAMSLPIPEFAQRRIASALERYRRWKGKDMTVAIPYITDIHDYRGYFPSSNTWESSKMHIRLLRTVAEAFDADLIGDLGDKGIDRKGSWRIPGNEAHLKVRVACERALYGDYSFSAMFNIPGNHDHGSIYAPFSNAEFGRLFNSFPANDRPGMMWGANRDYGRFDVPGKPCRVIFLNTTESPKGNGYGMEPTQVAFVRREMESTPAGWALLVFSHKCLHPSCGRWDCPDWKPQELRGFPEIRAVMKEAAARKDIHFVGCISGDSHFDLDYTEDGVRYLISQGYGGCGKKLHPKDQPSVTELGFNYGKDMLVDVACIKPGTGELRLFRVGVGDATRDR